MPARKEEEHSRLRTEGLATKEGKTMYGIRLRAENECSKMG